MNKTRPALYVFDIETDTSSSNALDPNVARITRFGIKNGDDLCVSLDNDDEYALLATADEILSAGPPGYLGGWYSAGFDIPFLITRSRIVGRDRGRPSPIPGLQAVVDHEITLKRPVMPGHGGGYRARWAKLVHVDVMNPWVAHAAEHGIEPSLKPVADSLSIPMIHEDARSLHLLSPEQVSKYNISDLNGTFELAERKFDELEQWCDRAALRRLMPPTPGLTLQ